MSTGTPRDLQVLCYQHHTGMLPKRSAEAGVPALYACREVDCLVRYDASTGYFLDTEDPRLIEQELKPQIRCPKDGHFMYFAEVRPEQRSFRLWKCPECNASRTHLDAERTAGA